MQQDQIGFCRRRIAEEERLGNQSKNPEEAASHFQLALLYKAQLRVLLRAHGEAADAAAESLAA